MKISINVDAAGDDELTGLQYLTMLNNLHDVLNDINKKSHKFAHSGEEVKFFSDKYKVGITYVVQRGSDIE